MFNFRKLLNTYSRYRYILHDSKKFGTYLGLTWRHHFISNHFDQYFRLLRDHMSKVNFLRRHDLFWNFVFFCTAHTKLFLNLAKFFSLLFFLSGASANSSFITFKSIFEEFLKSAFRKSFRIENISIFKDFDYFLIFPLEYVGNRHFLTHSKLIFEEIFRYITFKIDF